MRYKTKGTAADECIAFYDERSDVDPGAVGRLAVAQLTDGRRFIGVLARAPGDKNRYTLVNPFNLGRAMTVEIETASAVRWVRMEL